MSIIVLFLVLRLAFGACRLLFVFWWAVFVVSCCVLLCLFVGCCLLLAVCRSLFVVVSC